MAEEYKISLGVSLDTDDIASQVRGITTSERINIGVQLDTRDVQNQINSIRNQIQQLGDIRINLGGNGSGKGSRGGVQRVVNDANWAYRQMLDIQKKANSLSLKINGLDTSKNVNELKELSLQFARLRSDYETLKKLFRSQLSTVQFGNLQAEIDETNAKLSAMDAKIADTKAKLANSLSSPVGISGAQNQFSKVESDFNKLSGATNEVRISFDNLKISYGKLTAAQESYNDVIRSSSSTDEQRVVAAQNLIEANAKYQSALKTTNNLILENARAEKDAAAAQKLADDRTAFQSKINAWLTKNSAAVKKFGNSMLDLKSKAQNCDRTTLNHLEAEFKQVDAAAEAAGLKTQKLGDKIKTQFARYSSYLSVASLFMYATQGLKDMFNQVVAIDSAMTELKKVTDETDATYDKFLKNSAKRATEIGTTIDGLVSSTADFARLGYGFKDAQGLAEVANIYAVVGDEIEGVEQATESLISTMAAFKDDANNMSNTDFAMSIIDKYNEIGNKFAISSGGIGEALKRSASSLNAANNTIDESIALITAANTVVQNPDKVGNAFKTISMRIRGAKTELEEAGESTEGMAESAASMRQEIMALSGVDIMLNKNTFKSTYEIMDELADKWEDLSDIAQASIIELMAGKHQGNVFASLMENFDTAREALEVSMNSSGSAMQEHEKWSQSLEAQLLKVKAAWQALSQAFLSSDFLKAALDGIIGLVDGLTKLIDTFGALPTLVGTVAAGFSLFKNKGLFTFDKDIQSIRLFGNELIGLKGQYTKIQTAIERYNSLSTKSASFQEKYNQSLAKSSTSMGKYLNGLNGAKASFSGYIGSLVGARLKTIALQAATTALNSVMTMGISFLISTAISAILKWINAEEELAEKVEEVTSKFKEQHDELKKLQGDYDISNESSMVSKYEKLSKGVDALGRNVSLTAEEYSEYQSIVNTIADQIPSLVSGYDEQGNALPSCKGNVEQLTEAYEKLVHAQNQTILSGNAGDIQEDWENTLSQANEYDFWETIGNWASFDGIFGGKLDNYDMKTNTAKWLSSLTKETSKADIEQYLDDNPRKMLEVTQALQGAGYDVGIYDSNSDIAKLIEDALKNEPEKIKNILGNYYASFDDAIAEYKTKATALLSEAFDISSAISGLNYGNISEELQAVAYQTVDSLDFDFLNELSEKGVTIDQWTKEMLNQFNSLSEVDNKEIEAGFEFQTKFNGGEISYGEYVTNLRNLEDTIDGLNLKDEAKEQLKISVGLDDEGVIKQYETLVNRLTDPKNYDFNISEDEARKLLDGLSSEELAVAVDVITDLSNNNYSETAEEIKTAIERELAIQGLSLDLDIEVEKTKLEALSTAISESFSGSGLSSDSISAVEGMFSSLSSYDPSKLFERTANGISLNSSELRKLNSESRKTNLSKVNKQMDTLGDIYNQTREELYRLTYGTDEYNAKAAELSGIEQQIKDLEQLEAGYKGVASAFQEWQMVESAGSQRDMYESLIEGLENIDDEISRGWYDDGTIEYLELLTGKDLSTAGIEEVKKAYKGLGKEIEHTSYSIRDFFTVDDDGNSTNAGVYNFLDAIGQMEEEAFGGKDVVKRDDDGNIIGFDFQIVGGDKVIAEALGISEELVQIMVRAADDAGFVVSMDGTYQQLDVLKEKAQEAAVSLNRILEENGQKGFDFNFNTSDVDDITKQLGEAQKILDTFRNTDGTINTELKGADEALTVASTLQSMLDKLTRPAYMDIEANQVEDELREPLSQLQQLRRLTETEHQVKLSGGDTTQLQEEINELYIELDNLPEETKIELGLVDDKGNPLTGDALKEEVNNIVSGETELGIKATVDIQLEMDEKLGILVDKALLEAGIIDDEEFEKRVNIYLNADVDNEDAKEKTNKAVEEVANSKNGNSSSDNDSSDNKIEQSVDIKVTAKEIDTSDVTEKAKNAVESVKADVESVKNEIANMETDVENLSKSLQTLKELEKDISVSVDANLNGNVPYMDEAKEIDDLLIFAEGVKNLQELPENTNVSVDANLNGNVPDMNEGEQIDDLLMFAAGAEALQDLDDVSLSVDVSLSEDTQTILAQNEDAYTQDLQTLAKGIEELQNLDDVDVDIDVSLSDTTKDILEKNEDTFTQDLQTLAGGIEALQDLDKVNVSVNVSLTDATKDILAQNEDMYTQDLQTLAEGVEALQDLDDVNAFINVSLSEDTQTILYQNEDSFTNDLQTLAKGVEALQGLEDVNAKIDVSLSEDTKDILERNEDTFTQDLQTLAKGIQNLQNLEKVNLSVNIVLTEPTKDILEKNEDAFTNDLQTLAKGVKALQGLEDVNAKIDVSLSEDTQTILYQNENTFTQDLQTLAKGIQSLQGIADVDLSVNVVLTESTQRILEKNEDTFIQDLQTLATGIQSLQGASNVNAAVNVSIDGNAIIGDDATDRRWALDDFNTITKGMSSRNVVITVAANVDSENVNKAVQLLKDVANSGVFKDYNATVKVGATIATIDDTKVQEYKAPPKEGKVKYSVDSESSVYTWTAPDKDGVVDYSAEVEALTNAQKHKTGTITYKAKISGFPVVAGTANVGGTASGRAYAQGNWGIKGNGVALGGERGTEIVVRNGRWFTIGDEGAEFFRYKKNDIVFNAAQTESLFKYGGIKGANPRGKMLASGTAYVGGNAFGGSSGTGGAGSVGGNSVTGESYGSSSSSSDSSKDFEEVIDWIETILDRVERSIDKFEQQADNIYKSWSSRNTALQNQISEVGREISLQQQAYNKYMEAASGVGLSQEWIEKIQNGTIDIETITDETLKEKIDDYQKWYEKALDCKDAIEDLKESEASLYAQRFENTMTEYDGILQGFEHTEAMLNEYISQAEERGHIVSKEYYQALIDNEKSNIVELKKEQAELIAERDKAVEGGKIPKYSEEWYKMCAEIDGVTQAIEESETALISYGKSMRDIDWEVFELAQKRISEVTDESDFLIELMSNKKLYNDDGSLTSHGLATMGLHGQNYNTYMYQADDYGAKAREIKKRMELDPSDENYLDPLDQNNINKYNEYIELQRESILAAEDEKEAIRDMVEEGINFELDALQELIDKKNEELESERDLYEYQKKVKEQTEEIASLEKQMAAYSGDDSEEAMQKVQQIKVELESARQDLQETEYDKFIGDTSALLDALYLEYETILNTRLDNIDDLLSQVITGINAGMGDEGAIATALSSGGAIAQSIMNAMGENGSIKTILSTEAGNVGTTLSTAMNNIWSVGEGNAKSVLTMYGEGFQNQQTTTNAVLNGIKADVAAMVDDVDKDAKKKVNQNKTSPSSEKNPTSSGNNSAIKNDSKKDIKQGKKTKITEDTLKGIASAIWIYGSDSGWGNNPFREDKLNKKIGDANAKKVQDIINSQGSSGKLYDFWIKNGKNLDKYKYKAFKSGAKDINMSQLAWTQENAREFIVRPSDGAILTPVAKGDSVLNAIASNNIWNMANNPTEFIKNNLGLDGANIPRGANVNNTYSQHIDNVVFRMDNVKNYDEMLSAMRDDKNFERLVLSMTIDQIAGKSKLAKGKSIR